MSGDEKFPGKLIFGGKIRAAKSWTRKFNIAKYYREGKISGDEKFRGKLIFGEKIWATKG